MPRIDLQVPITEKDAAKHLGARWDSQNKAWYVPDGIDATPLQKWIAVPESPNIRAEQLVPGDKYTSVLIRLTYLAAHRGKK